MKDFQQKMKNEARKPENYCKKPCKINGAWLNIKICGWEGGLICIICRCIFQAFWIFFSCFCSEVPLVFLCTVFNLLCQYYYVRVRVRVRV